MNPIFFVERAMYRALTKGEDLPEDVIRKCSKLLGQPSKKMESVIARYRQVFERYLSKRCTRVSETEEVCIYTLSSRAPFKPMPVTMCATGTVILYREGEPAELLAYPMPKALSYAKSPGLPAEEYGDVIPREVSLRLDGWQLNAYYNPLLKRWIFSTRYVLHNMYFERGRLVEEPFNTIANPYVYVADKLAEEQNLYQVLDKYRGWTFTFVLIGPEPAITHPPYPLGTDYRQYRLVPLMARDPTGKLYTWSETAALLGSEGPPLIELRKRGERYNTVRRSLTIRSYIAFIDRDDPENPLLAELESELYPDAMNVKYMYSAKSVAILTYEDAADKLVEIVDENLKPRIERLAKLLIIFEDKLRSAASRPGLPDIAKRLTDLVNEIANRRVLSADEVIKNLEKGNVKRIAKKISSLVLEEHSIATEDPIIIIEKLIDAISV